MSYVDWSGVSPARALHYVLKIGDRKKTIDFYRNILCMKVLRHEEFEEGCKATCNGPYNGKWSKTMIGYGAEDQHFVIELTYNYNVGSYKKGNDLSALFLDSDEVYHKISGEKHSEGEDGRLLISDPDGYQFAVSKGNGSFISKVSIQAKDLDQSIAFWKDELGMALVEKNEKKAILAFGDKQCNLELLQLPADKTLDRGTAFGRIAFAYPGSKLKDLENKIKYTSNKIIKELTTLETPGKVDVQVVILADPNDHEICFVGEEGFKELAVVDKNADSILDDAIKKDDSASWYHDGKPHG